MIRSVLVIDDESAILDGIEQMLLRNLQDIEVIKCGNGLLACEKLCQKDFDVVISDVMMPEMTGIQFLQHIKQKGYSLGILMISGYDDFQYVRESMRLGASDYLLKPVQQDELIAAVGQLLKHAESGRRKNVSIELGEDVFTYLIHQEFELKEEIRARLNGQDIDGTTEVLPILVQSKKIYLELLQSKLKEILPKEGIHKFYISVRQGMLYLLVFGVRSTRVPEILADMQERNPEYLIRYGTIPSVCSVSQLPKMLETCGHQLEQSYFDIPFTLPAVCKSMEEYLDDAKAAVRHRDLGRIVQSLDGYLACAQYGRIEREFLIKSLANWLYSLLGEMNGLIRVVSKYKLTEYDLIEQIQNSPRLSVLRKKFRDIWEVYIEEYENSGNRRSVQMDKVKEFVQNHLALDCQITEAAEMIGVSPNYLSAIFKEYMGITFRDYVREERIKRAMELIGSTNMKLYEIAAAVGYQDPGHFSRAFKQVTGFSPQHFLKL